MMVRELTAAVLALGMLSSGSSNSAFCDGEMADASTWVTVRVLAQLYGPGDWFASQVREIRVVACDLDDDGRDERIAVLLDGGDLYRMEPLTLAALRHGISCRGFAVLKCVEGRWWPAIYQYFDFDGRALRLDWIDGLACAQLVSDGGRDNVKSRWGWNRSLEDEWFTPAWDACSCQWNRDEEAYGPWTWGSPMSGGISLK